MVVAVETGIVVRNVEPMFTFYRNVLGFDPYGEVSLPGIHVRGLRPGQFHTEINPRRGRRRYRCSHWIPARASVHHAARHQHQGNV